MTEITAEERASSFFHFLHYSWSSKELRDADEEELASRFRAVEQAAREEERELAVKRVSQVKDVVFPGTTRPYVALDEAQAAIRARGDD